MSSTLIVTLAFSLVVFVSPHVAVGQTGNFVYQGRLQNGGVPANGLHDFEFLLFDSLSGGTQIGPTLTRNGVTVSNGLFSVSLDFGPQFPGAERFLEIRVRIAGEPGMTILAPREAVTSAPYSIRSLTAETAVNAANAAVAATANDALQLGGVPANQFVLTTDPRLNDARNPLPGNTNYIQNSTTLQAASNFNISGDGTAGGTMTGNILNAATQYNLNGVRVFSNAGTNNLFAGANAGGQNTGSGNAFVGAFAGAGNSSGSNNAFFGRGAGVGSTAGAANTFLGTSAGLSNVTGSNNTIIGFEANLGAANLNNSIAIGHRALSGCSNCMVLGSISGVNGAVADTNVGIGTSNPLERLHVAGNGLFTGGLTVNGAFNAALPAGSTSYIQNTAVQQAASNFNISGDGTAGGTLSGNIVNAATQFDLNGNRILASPGSSNFFAGPGTGFSNTTGSANAFFGNGAGVVNSTGSSNSFFGTLAGNQNSTGQDNSFFGRSSGSQNTSGFANSFFGQQAGQSNSTGSGNSYFGHRAGISADSATGNSFFGREAGSGITGNSNSVFGSFAGISSSDASFNAYFGMNTGRFNTSGERNAFFGQAAGFGNTTGSSNTFIGGTSGLTNTVGNANTTIGRNSDVGSNDLTNATAIGANSLVAQSNSLVLGSIQGTNGATASTNVGIGTASPSQRLHVVGNTLFAGNLTVTGTFSATLPSNSASYIQNTNSQQASSNFNISGNGTAGGTLSGSIVNADAQFNQGGFRLLATDGNGNLFVGSFAGQDFDVSGQNTFVGTSAGRATTTGGVNTFVGADAGFSNLTGGGNSFLGRSAGFRNTTGINNTFFGLGAGNDNTIGNGNTSIGSESNMLSADLENATAIGFRAAVSQNNSLVLGSINGVNNANANTRVGIGTTAPERILHLRGPGSQELMIESTDLSGRKWTIQSSGDGGGGRFEIVDRTAVANRFTILSDGLVGIGTATPVDRLHVAGIIRVNSLGAAGATDLCRNASNQISTCSSSIRYKSNINAFNEGLGLVRKLRPVSFNWINGGMPDVGFVAEEVAGVEPLLTTANANGEVEGVKYGRISVVLVNAIKEQQDEIEALRQTNEGQQRKLAEQAAALAKQQAEIEALRKISSELESVRSFLCKHAGAREFCSAQRQ